jgi:N4-gp56 family major capsid protein
MAFNGNINGVAGDIGAASPTTGTLSANHKFYNRVFLENFYTEVMPAMYGKRTPVDKHRGKTAVWNRLDKAAAKTTTTTEGVTETSKKRTLTRIEVTLDQYSDNWEFSDMQLDHGVEGVFTETSELAGKTAQLTENRVVYVALQGGSNVRYGAGVASRVLTNTPMAVADLNYAISALRTAHAVKFSGIAKGSGNDNTTPINSAYVCIVHEDQKEGIEGITGFNQIDKYAASGVNMWPGEFGSYKEVRFVADTDIPFFAGAGAGAKDVYSAVMMGKDAFGVPYVGSQNAELTTMGLGSGGSNDPNKQRATVGYKMLTAAIILQTDQLISLENTLS